MRWHMLSPKRFGCASFSRIFVVLSSRLLWFIVITFPLFTCPVILCSIVGPSISRLTFILFVRRWPLDKFEFFMFPRQHSPQQRCCSLQDLPLLPHLQLTPAPLATVDRPLLHSLLLLFRAPRRARPAARARPPLLRRAGLLHLERPLALTSPSWLPTNLTPPASAPEPPALIPC